MKRPISSVVTTARRAIGLSPDGAASKPPRESHRGRQPQIPVGVWVSEAGPRFSLQIFCFHGEEPIDDGRGLFLAASFSLQLLASVASQSIEARSSIVLGGRNIPELGRAEDATRHAAR
jgi:hypothetical protein